MLQSQPCSCRKFIAPNELFAKKPAHRKSAKTLYAIIIKTISENVEYEFSLIEEKKKLIKSAKKEMNALVRERNSQRFC